MGKSPDLCLVCRAELPPPLRTPIKDGTKLRYVLQTCPSCGCKHYDVEELREPGVADFRSEVG